MYPQNSRTIKTTIAWLCIPAAVLAWFYLRPNIAPAEAYAGGLKAAKANEWKQVVFAIEQIGPGEEFAPHRAMLQGFLEAGEGKNDMALLQFSKAQSHPDTREESYFQAGTICYRLKEFREAVQLLQQVTEWNPDHEPAHRLLAASFYDIGAMDQTLEQITHVMRLAPEDHRPYFMKASILQDYEQFQVAATVFAEAAELADPNSPADISIRSGWSECLLRLGKYQEALSVVEALSSTAEIDIKKAEALYFLRQYEPAQQLVDRLLPTHSENVGLVAVAVRLFEHTEEYDRGIELVLAALKISPHNIRLQSSAADIFGAAGELAKAREYRELAAKTGELQQRFSQLHQTAVKDVNNAALRLELAQVAEMLGKLKIARTWYEAAIGMAPDDPQIQTQWTRFQQDHVEVFLNSRVLPR